MLRNKIYPNIFIIEGIDRVGKSTLIRNIKDALGYYLIIHYGKPERLNFYRQIANEISQTDNEAYEYQFACFKNMMSLLRSDARIIFDRSHIGEYVYSPLYRGYYASYIFDLEKTFEIEYKTNIRLILLTEDFDLSTHFKDDGKSLGSVNSRILEQDKFIEAYKRSIISQKRIVCVTNPITGEFKNPLDILKEVIE